MTQANNRHGADWAGVTPLTAAEINALDRRGGTESNRARAARGGPMGGDVLSVYLDGQRIAGAPMDLVDVAGAQCGCGAYPGQDHWSDCATLERPGDHESPTGPRCNCGLPPDGTGGHASGCPARRSGQGTEMPAVTREQPAPAPGQAWAPAAERWAEYLDADGTITIGSVERGYAHPSRSDGKRRDFDGIQVQILAQGWSCVGVTTPHGRVAIGDAFASATGARRTYEVVGVNGTLSDSVVLSGDAGTACATLIAATWTRTRYAPARAGERYARRGGTDWFHVTLTNVAMIPGGRMDPAQWERLDPGQGAGPRVYAALKVSVNGRELRDVTGNFRPDTATGAALDALAATMGVERKPSREPVRVSFTIKAVAETAAAFQRIEAAAGSEGRPFLTLQAPAPQLRALFDAIGRALELPATRHVCALGEGLTVTVLRDEMLFTPTAETGLGTADLAGDARALCALRAAVATAMATGRATLAQWGAKGPRVEVRREGGPMVVPPAEQASEPPRYTPDVGGGVDQWRWEV